MSSFDSFYIFHIFLGRVCVVETKVTYTAVFFCDAEIKANSFGMADVKIAVGLGRETRLHFSTIFTFFQVFLYCLFNKVQAFLFACFFVFNICHNG